MTESTPSAPNVAAEIDRMVAGNGTRQFTSVQGDQGAYRVIAEPQPDGTLKTTTTVQRRPSVSTGDSARLPDSGIDIQRAASDLQDAIAAKQAKLEAIAGYDQRTGAPRHILEQGSKARADAERELAQLRVSAAHQLQQWNRLAAQRVGDAARTSAADRERAMTEAFTRGDPSRAAALRSALEQAEATEAAAAIIQARRGAR